MAGLAAPVIIDATYTVVGGTAVRAGIGAALRSAFTAAARVGKTALGWAFGGAAMEEGAAIVRGTSSAPTPLAGGGGGGGVSIPRGTSAAPASSGGGGLPVPITKSGNLPATVRATPVASVPKGAASIPVSLGKSAGKAVVVGNGLTSIPNIIPAQTTNGLALPVIGAAAAASATAYSMLDEAKANPMRTAAIALGVAALGVAVYSAAKR